MVFHVSSCVVGHVGGCVDDLVGHVSGCGWSCEWLCG